MAKDVRFTPIQGGTCKGGRPCDRNAEFRAEYRVAGRNAGCLDKRMAKSLCVFHAARFARAHGGGSIDLGLKVAT